MTKFMRYATLLGLLLPLSAVGTSALEAQAAAPAAQMPEVTDARLQVYARAFLDVVRVQDEFDPLLAAARNKTGEAQVELRIQRREAVHKALETHGMTEQEYNWVTFVVSSNEDRRAAFERFLESARTGEPVTP